MVNYKIVNERIVHMNTPLGDEFSYSEQGGDIIEIKTEQIVKSGLGMKKAKELCRHLNFGGGFDGWTPTFFLAK